MKIYTEDGKGGHKPIKECDMEEVIISAESGRFGVCMTANIRARTKNGFVVEFPSPEDADQFSSPFRDIEMIDAAKTRHRLIPLELTQNRVRYRELTRHEVEVIEAPARW